MKWMACLLTAVTLTSPAMAQETSCDGVDDDNDGFIDEDFDLDGDGVARCCDLREFFVTRTGALYDQIEAIYSDGTGGFEPGLTPIAESLGVLVGLGAVADFDNDGSLDVLWRDATNADYYLTSCLGEWQTWKAGTFDEINGAYVTSGDTDGDGCMDLLGWDVAGNNNLNPVHGPSGLNPDLGIGLGVTALGHCDGTFTELYGTWAPDVSLGQWGISRTQRLYDMTCDGIPDMVHHDYPNGGASDTTVYLHPGVGDGTFLVPGGSLFVTSSAPQNTSDLGDVNMDGCPDWVGGPDDDGDRGSVVFAQVACDGQGIGGQELVDTCDPDSDCSGGSVPGLGMSALHDWDGDGDKDLLTSRTHSDPVQADFLLWTNDGLGGFTASVVFEDGTNSAFQIPNIPEVWVDTDDDKVNDRCDRCPGFDDAFDDDDDGVPNGCDTCMGFNDRVDDDGDGVPNGCDLCPGAPDLVDSDEDSVPDGCDTCPDFDDSLDVDDDTIADACDNCVDDFNPDQADADADATGDDCDPCPDAPDEVDADSDGFLSCEDCDDTNADVNPDRAEIANGVDDNCDGAVDEGVAAPDTSAPTPEGCGCVTTGSLPTPWALGILWLAVGRRRSP